MLDDGRIAAFAATTFAPTFGPVLVLDFDGEPDVCSFRDFRRVRSWSASEVRDTTSESRSSSDFPLRISSIQLNVPSFFSLSSFINESFVPPESSESSSPSTDCFRRFLVVLDSCVLLFFLFRPPPLPDSSPAVADLERFRSTTRLTHFPWS